MLILRKCRIKKIKILLLKMVRMRRKDSKRRIKEKAKLSEIMSSEEI
jgi:hypothetical protein